MTVLIKQPLTNMIKYDHLYIYIYIYIYIKKKIIIKKKSALSKLDKVSFGHWAQRKP
jgi:hypothetical protein